VHVALHTCRDIISSEATCDPAHSILATRPRTGRWVQHDVHVALHTQITTLRGSPDTAYGPRAATFI
jgi:hypothetical protein